MEIEKAMRSDLNSLPDYAAYCINLDEHDQKWKRCQIEGASANLGFTRIPGTRGSYLPDSILTNLGEGVSDKFKGTLGCFLSHLHAWELFLKSNKDFALVVEDDFRPMVRFPSTIASFGLPDSFDICWMNERMDLSKPGSPVFKDIQHAVRKRASSNWRACGAEGYIISRSGAVKLTQYVQEDGLLGDVD
jgi:glycosyl transferase family 25